MSKEEKYLIGLVSILRDYLVNESLSKEDLNNILSHPPSKFVDFVSKYELKGKIE